MQPGREIKYNYALRFANGGGEVMSRRRAFAQFTLALEIATLASMGISIAFHWLASDALSPTRALPLRCALGFEESERANHGAQAVLVQN